MLKIMTNEEYRSVRAYANSDLTELARLRFGAEATDNQINPAIAQFGTGFHTAILEPDRQIEVNRVTDKARIYQMREAYFKALEHGNPYGLQSGFNLIEQSLFWTDPVTGLPCKCRPDGVIEYNGMPLIVDLKSTSCKSVQQFYDTIIKYGYDRQAAWYEDGYYQCFESVPQFMFIAVQKVAPFDVWFIHMGEFGERADIIREGRRKNRRLLIDAAQEAKFSRGWRPKSWGAISNV